MAYLYGEVALPHIFCQFNDCKIGQLGLLQDLLIGKPVSLVYYITLKL